jgi:hypothetical protein
MKVSDGFPQVGLDDAAAAVAPLIGLAPDRAGKRQ